MKYFPNIKKNGVPLPATTRMSPENMQMQKTNLVRFP